MKECTSDQIRNPATNRCVKKDGKIGQSILTPPKRKKTPPKNKKTPPKKKKTPSKKECVEGKILNPKTNICVKIDGKIGRDILSKSVNKKLVRPKENCLTRSKIPLRDHQKRVAKFMDKNNGIGVIHSTGTGKTLTAIAVSECFLDKNSNGRVIFIGPASLTSNFRKELDKYGNVDSSAYSFYSFDKFYSEHKGKGNLPKNLKNILLIIDEVHNLRNPESVKSLLIQEFATKVQKRLVLSATPFVNNLEDFIPLINIIHGKTLIGLKKQYIEDEVKEYLTWKVEPHNLDVITDYLAEKISVVRNDDDSDFPEKIEEHKKVNMTRAYFNAYKKVLASEKNKNIWLKNPEKFLHGYRRVVNKAGDKYFSLKIESAIPILRKGKAIIYSNWLEFGLDPIALSLKNAKISFKLFSGETPISERQKIVDDFNDDKFDALIFTKAGGEGLDLKGTKSVIVMDPPWNDAGLQQIIGRAIRYKSHAHLPKDEQKVHVYYMELKQPIGDPELDTGDSLLYSIIEKKKETNELIQKLLEEISIEQYSK